MDIEKLKFPIGQFHMPPVLSQAELQKWIDDIRDFPKFLRSEVEDLTPADLERLHRPGGWTIRQMVHHCADSHMNGFIRLKLGLSEEQPTVKPYDENKWVLQADAKMPVQVSLALLDCVHARWAFLLASLSPADFSRSYFHPGANRSYTLSESTGDYAWHGRHHLAHIVQARANRFA